MLYRYKNNIDYVDIVAYQVIHLYISIPSGGLKIFRWSAQFIHMYVNVLYHGGLLKATTAGL